MIVKLRAAGWVLAAVALVMVLPAAGAAASREILEVLVTNWPETWKVVGTVAVTGGPIRQAELIAKRDILVPPVSPKDTARLISAGVLVTDGYPQLVLSLTGQTKGQIGRTGAVGAILVPDEDPMIEALDEGGVILFPIQVAASGVSSASPYFASDQPRFATAFPRYRVLLYNTTDKTVTVQLYAWLTS